MPTYRSPYQQASSRQSLSPKSVASPYGNQAASQAVGDAKQFGLTANPTDSPGVTNYRSGFNTWARDNQVQAGLDRRAAWEAANPGQPGTPPTQLDMMQDLFSQSAANAQQTMANTKAGYDNFLRGMEAKQNAFLSSFNQGPQYNENLMNTIIAQLSQMMGMSLMGQWLPQGGQFGQPQGYHNSAPQLTSADQAKLGRNI